MSTTESTQSTIAGLDADSVEAIRDYYENIGIPDLAELHADCEENSVITQAHIDQFLLQLDDGERCGYCGAHIQDVNLIGVKDARCSSHL